MGGLGRGSSALRCKDFHAERVFYFLCPPCSQWPWSQSAKERLAECPPPHGGRGGMTVESSKLTPCTHTAFLRHKSHTQFTRLKHAVQWFVVCSQRCAAVTTINLRTLLSPPKKPVAFSNCPTVPSRAPPQPKASTNLLSVSLVLPVLDSSCKWNHIIRGPWLLSLSVCFQGSSML